MRFVETLFLFSLLALYLSRGVTSEFAPSYNHEWSK